MDVVVIDTNVFARSTYMCRKDHGPMLVGVLRATNGKIFMPEVLKGEAFEQVQAMVDEGFDKLQKFRGNLNHLIDLPELLAPTAGAVQQSVQQRLDELSPIILEGPAVDDLLKPAGRRSMAKQAPTTKSDHGLKDCMIWEAVLTLPSGTKVWLASADGGFYKNGTDELHPDLQAEAQARGIDIKIARNLLPIIRGLVKDRPELDLAELEQRERLEQSKPLASSIPPAPVTSEVPASTGDLDAVKVAVDASQQAFDGLELKVLGYVSYLDPVNKSDLVEALSFTGITAEIVANVAERLVLGGLIRDSGSKYLIVDRSIQEAAAANVEGEMIRWLESKRTDNG